MFRLTLSTEDHQRLAAATAAAGATTSARFELAVVPVSDRYHLYPIAYGAGAALLAAGLLALFEPALSLRAGFAAEAALFAIVSLALEWLPLRLLLVPRHVRRGHAREMAHRAFAAHILAARERKPGMVLFVSLGERAIELVTDDELDRRIGQAAWNRIIDDFARAAKAGRRIEGLESAIAACGAALAEHFPR